MQRHLVEVAAVLPWASVATLLPPSFTPISSHLIMFGYRVGTGDKVLDWRATAKKAAPYLTTAAKMYMKAKFNQRQNRSVRIHEPVSAGGMAVVRTKRMKLKKRFPGKSFSKKVMSVLFPPISCAREYSVDFATQNNRKHYLDMNSYDGSVAGIQAGRTDLINWISAAITANNASGSNASVTSYNQLDEYWVMKSNASYEITNLTNAPTYFRVHTFTPKKATNFYAFLRFCDYYISQAGNAMYPGESAIESATVEVITDSNIYNQQVLTNIFDSGPLKDMLNDFFIHEKSPEYLLQPQGILKYNVTAIKKPFLFTEKYSRMAANTIVASEDIPYISKYVILEVVGQTGRTKDNTGVLVNRHVNSLPGYINISHKRYFKFVPRTANRPLHKVLTRVDVPALVGSDIPVVFGDINNGAVNAAG